VLWQPKIATISDILQSGQQATKVLSYFSNAVSCGAAFCFRKKRKK